MEGVKQVIPETVEQSVQAQALTERLKPLGINPSFEVFAFTHESADDSKGLRERIQESDIYIPELPEWDENVLQTFLEISQGKITPEEVMNSPQRTPQLTVSHFREIFEAFYDSNKFYGFIDIPKNHPLVEKFKEISPFNINQSGSLNDLLTSIRDYLRLGAEAEREREDYMLSQIDKVVAQAIEMHPEFKQKDKLNILISLGAYHTNVHHLLKRGFPSAKLSFSKKPFLYSYEEEAEREYEFGKYPNDELVARAYLDILLNIYYRLYFTKLTDNSQLIVNYQRKLINQFSFPEIEEMFDKMKSAGSAWSVLFERLEAKDISFPPESESDLI